MSYLHSVFTHLENKNSYIRMLFGKRNTLGFGTTLCNWILDLLTYRPQGIWTGSHTSSTLSSVCVWSLSRDSYVDSRLPKRVFHAQCLTSGCVNLQGRSEDEALEAKPIYYRVLVLHRVQKPKKRGGKKRRYDFRLGTEMIPVGCTCVRPSVVPQQ
ncbi:interleukin 17a/f3 [Plectropomus leopardus]|uniref:interleukin 17a/f3 n=1 Tax=Plectropomus leopardus TaxID=160734 RepID=UPI001C4BC0E1|nr:interleukin 17a/f3 [Plectropomus leopardus]